MACHRSHTNRAEEARVKLSEVRERAMAEQLAETLKNLSADPAQLLQYWTTHNIDVQQPLDVFSAALRHLDATQQPLAYLLIL